MLTYDNDVNKNARI